MRVSRRRLQVSAALVIGLLVPATPTAATAAATATAEASDSAGFRAAYASRTPAPQRLTAEVQRLTGILQTVIREHPRSQRVGDERPFKVLRVGTRAVPLSDGSLTATRDGATLAVTLTPASDGSQRVLSATTIAAPAATAIPSTHQVYVALVRPVGVDSDPSVTDASTRAIVAQVSQYWASQTGNKVSFVTAAVQSYQSRYGCTGTAGTYNMWAEALARMPAAAGPGKHLVVVAPGGASSLGCDYGFGTIGSLDADGNQVFVSGLNQSLLAHELGHNLGLFHANSLRCGAAQDMPMVGSTFPGCQANAYDDLFDVMGFSGADYGEGNLNAAHLDAMDVFPNAIRRIQATSGTTTARITPLSAPLTATAANRALKVTDPNGASYFVEYRTNSGRDAVASRNPWQPAWGVRVLRDDPQAPPSAGSYVLDATPTGNLNTDYNRVIPTGSTLVAASRKLTIRVTAADSAGATLAITVGTVPAAVPSTVSLTILPRALVGVWVTASTRVTDQFGKARVNQLVTLQKMQKGTTIWRWVSTQRTTATGTASFKYLNGLSGSYRWVTVQATGAPSRYSPARAVTSIAAVSENRPATSVTRGAYLSVTGSVSAVPAPVVYVQYGYAGGPWRTGPRATVKGTAVSARVALSVRATAYVRLYVAPATAYSGSISSSYATTVK